jgi:hypothetical protein
MCSSSAAVQNRSAGRAAEEFIAVSIRSILKSGDIGALVAAASA